VSPQSSAGPDTAIIFDIQRFCVHDGPGVRTTVFFKGCPLACEWCQNPESLRDAPDLMVFGELCIKCGACAAVCAHSAAPGGTLPNPPPPQCDVCGRCVAACPAGARRIAGRVMTLDEVASAVLRDKAFYGHNGGVTFGGGEPLSQWPFVRKLAARLRKDGVRTALDTTCCAPPGVIANIPTELDLVLADFKALSPDIHRRWTGMDNTEILAALRKLCAEMTGRIWISVPLIPGVHAGAELTRMARFVGELAGPPPVRFLPYHRFGESKHRALGRGEPWKPAGAAQVVAEDAERIFRAAGLTVIQV